MDKNNIVLLDLFSGIGGFHKGLEHAGFNITKTFFSEIDKHAISVYQNNYKEAEYVGSVVDVRGKDIQRPNIITFGSPCQDFSLAGKRAGMGGQRSPLISHAIRLITETRPDFFIWENVKGAFSSNNGADFWGIIKAFADIGGYRLEWQLLNTAWFLPQNRERIYLVGSLGEGSGREIFPIRKNVGKPKTISNKEQGIEEWFQATSISSTITEPQKMRNCDTFINVINNGNKIRRLTPIETERLQGFPDNWTKYGVNGNIISDSQRYKMCGNAVSVPVVKAVGEAILKSL